MKTLKEFIKEQVVEAYRLNNVIVTYFIEPKDLVVEVPETYSESDIQIYLGDKYFNELPAYNEFAQQFFGLNADNIYDVRFEYTYFEQLPENNHEQHVAWDTKYDKNYNNDIVLRLFKLHNIKYIIEFDRFDLINVDNTKIKDELIKIFKSAESNNENKYPLNIKFNQDSLKYRT